MVPYVSVIFFLDVQKQDHVCIAFNMGDVLPLFSCIKTPYSVCVSPVAGMYDKTKPSPPLCLGRGWGVGIVPDVGLYWKHSPAMGKIPITPGPSWRRLGLLFLVLGCPEKQAHLPPLVQSLMGGDVAYTCAGLTEWFNCMPLKPSKGTAWVEWLTLVQWDVPYLLLPAPPTFWSRFGGYGEHRGKSVTWAVFPPTQWLNWIQRVWQATDNCKFWLGYQILACLCVYRICYCSQIVMLLTEPCKPAKHIFNIWNIVNAHCFLVAHIYSTSNFSRKL